MEMSGRLVMTGLGGKNPSLGIEVDIDGVKRQLDYTFRFRQLDDAAAKVVADVADEAVVAIKEADVELKEAGNHLAFSGVGDATAVMQSLIGLCERLGDFGLMLADGAGEGEKARKVKAKRQR